MQVRLLGQVDVMVDGRERPVAGRRRKAVLATLALRSGEIVGTDRLVDAARGENAPVTALKAQNRLTKNGSVWSAEVRRVGVLPALFQRPPRGSAWKPHRRNGRPHPADRGDHRKGKQ